MNPIKVSVFGTSLRNRNKLQTDGTCTGEDFRNQYLKEISNAEWWNNEQTIELDFSGVDTLGPSWANEVFAFFTQIPGVNKDRIFSKIKILNISRIKLETIEQEVEDGYRGIQWL